MRRGNRSSFPTSDSKCSSALQVILVRTFPNIQIFRLMTPNHGMEKPKKNRMHFFTSNNSDAFLLENTLMLSCFLDK